MNFLKALEEVSKEKNIKPDILLDALRTAVTMAYRKKFGQESDVRVDFETDSGELKILSRRICVAKVTDPQTQIDLAKARKLLETAAEGEVIEIPVDAAEFGRVAVKAVKQIVTQNLAEEERESRFDEIFRMEHRLAEGRVQRVEYKRQGTVYLELGKVEVALPYKSQIPGEGFSIGDRVRVFVQEVKRKLRIPQVTVSRTCTEFLAKLFEAEIPEIQEGLVKVKSVAREAGSRAKVAIFSDDTSIDPVGACVGIRGSRIQGIVEELNGEKLDIVRFSTNMKEFITNALSPARVLDVRYDREKNSAEVIVPPDQISLAIGSGGQNVRLATRLVNCHLDIKAGIKE